MELINDQIERLIENNQTATKQIGYDLIALKKAMIRDMQDRWTMIAEHSKEIDKLKKQIAEMKK